jgi:hypothetical protein
MLNPIQHGIGLPGKLTELHGALDEFPFLVLHCDKNNLSPADRLDRCTRDDHHALPARGAEGHRHIHPAPKMPIRIGDLYPDFGRPRLRIYLRIDVGHMTMQPQIRIGKRHEAGLRLYSYRGKTLFIQVSHHPDISQVCDDEEFLAHADHLAEVGRAYDDHVSILKAITRREGARAEALFREHAYRSRENKQILLQSMKQQRSTPAPPGLKLVAGI